MDTNTVLQWVSDERLDELAVTFDGRVLDPDGDEIDVADALQAVADAQAQLARLHKWLTWAQGCPRPD